MFSANAPRSHRVHWARLRQCLEVADDVATAQVNGKSKGQVVVTVNRVLADPDFVPSEPPPQPRRIKPS
jgi:hypothetical protein